MEGHPKERLNRNKKSMAAKEVHVSDAAAEAGQAIYNKAVLSVYDWWVLGFSNSYLWHCPTSVLREQFESCATDNHLDVGVGTGYFLDNCLNGKRRRLALLDMNENSLEKAAERVVRFEPEKYRFNIMAPLNLNCDGFNSMSLSYLFHCLPGPIEEKISVFDRLLPYLKTGGVVFGSTILGKDVELGFFARKLMSIYNEKGIFDNYEDSLEALTSCLGSYFSKIDINVVGCVALFTART